MKTNTNTSKSIRFFSLFFALILSIALSMCGWKPAIAAPVIGSKEEMGLWEKVPPPRDLKTGKILPLESVHTSLLPNGKVLIVNGSSNRNTLQIGQDTVKFIDGVQTSNQAVVNNSALFEPDTGKFTPIASPPAVQNGDSNDLFCTGHIHLPNGDVLFVGGSNRYYPGEQFEGSKQTNIYDWETNRWSTIGKMVEGRWYPSLVPLADGKIVIFSGLKYNKPNQITPTLDIYDPATTRLNHIDLASVSNSPFNTKITQYQFLDAQGKPVIKQANLYDSIDLYPRIFPTPDGKLLITGDGAGKFPLEVHKSNKTYLMSVTTNPSGQLAVSFELGPDRQDISKVYGTAVSDPNAEGDVLLIGGILNANNINFGKPQFGRLDDPNSTNGKMLAQGARIARTLERWNSQGKTWEIAPNFLDKPRSMNQAVILPDKEILTINGGEFAEYKQIYEPLLMVPDQTAQGGYKTKPMNPATLPRFYHNGALLLPDARVLSIGGNASRAAREEDGTVRVDVVPDTKEYYALAKLTKTPQTKGSGQVISEGDYNKFLEDFYKSPESYFVEGDSVPFAPAEIWQAEIFSPPYLFKPGKRPNIKEAPQILKYGQSESIVVEQSGGKGSLVLIKLGTTTHSFDYGQRLADLEIEAYADDNSEASIKFKTPKNANLYPPGYYMMFYVNAIGKPSKATMVKLEA